MKKLAFILLVLVVGQCSAYLIKVPTKPTEPRTETVGWFHIQKLMLPLFENVCEDSANEIVVRLSNEFNFDAITGGYIKPNVVDNLRNLRTSKGFLPKGEIFTEYNTSHINEVKILYEFFYYAKDFDTFYKSACWARQNVNCGVFVDAIYLAVLNRRDTSKILIPAPYELIPNYFIPKETIFKASILLLEPTTVEDVRVGSNEYIIDANYTVQSNEDSEDSKLAYFREDIGLNSYYFLRKLRNAPWLNVPSNVNNNYGEYMYMMMKQFAARYDLERYSNGLPELEILHWESEITSYDPMLVYSNGNEFGHRAFSGFMGDKDEINFLKTIENNLASVASHLKQAGYNKTQILNHLIEILVTSEKNYENLARKLLGSDGELSKGQYSTMEHYMTSMRDPVFWKINKKIVELIDNALKILPSYSKAELYFPGVEVLNVETKKMMTSFESFQFDVTDSLKVIDRNATFQVKISQMRLSHKPFTIKVNISSLITQKGLIKIYLGPKTMPGEFAAVKNSFLLLDRFEFNFKQGINIVSRSSEEMKSFSSDFTSLKTIRKKVDDAEFGLDALPLSDVESQIGYPSRLVLPKGLPEGLPCQLFVFVAPFTKNNVGGSFTLGNTIYNSAILSPGYPLDLSIEEKQLFNLPNVLKKDITIMHKGEVKSSEYGGKTGPNRFDSSNSYGSKRFDYSAKHEKSFSENDYASGDQIDMNDEMHGLLGERPSFTYKNKENNDYSAKRNQYKYKENYRTKQNYNVKEDLQIKEQNMTFKKSSPSLSDTEFQESETKRMFSGEVDGSPLETTNIHYLLSERPSFSYRNKDGSNQFRNKENFSKSHAISIDKSYPTTENSGSYENNAQKVHSLLGSSKRYYYKNENSNSKANKKQMETEIKQKYHSSKTSKYGRKYDNYKYNESDTEPNDLITFQPKYLIHNDDEVDTSYGKVHGMLGVRPEFTYKNTNDYSAKKNQYKDKKEQYSKKRTDFIKSDSEIASLATTTEKQTEFLNNYNTKFNQINDNNNLGTKIVTENKNVGTVTKEAFESPVTKKIDAVTIKEIIRYPFDEDSLKSDQYVDDTLNSNLYDPYEPDYVKEKPKKKVTVYDYLFNNIFDNEEVYE